MINLTASLCILALLLAAFGFWAFIGTAATLAKAGCLLLFLFVGIAYWHHHHMPHL